MIIATLSEDERQVISEELSGHMYECLIAFDPIDQSFKFKFDGGTWSPPFGTFQPPDLPSARSWNSGMHEFIIRTMRSIGSMMI